MTIFELHAELKFTNELLERIAVALERAVGPVAEDDDKSFPRPSQPTQPQDIRRIDVYEKSPLQQKLERKVREK